MHVCHFCETSVEGAYFRNIAEGMIEKGVEVSLVELGPHKPPKWLLEVPKAKYFSLGISGRLSYPLAVWRLSRLLKREKVDILQTHLFNAGLISAMTRQLWRKPVYVYMRHHTSGVRMFGTRLHVAADKWMAEKADHLLTVSNAAREYMKLTDGIKKKIDVVHLGFDFDKIAPDPAARERTRREFGFDEKDFVIGYVAHFAPGKGHRQLVDAFADISREIPEARLLFVGPGSLPEVDVAVEKHSLREKITFAGWRDDVVACMNAMDLFVQPSLSEAFSQVLIEAMGVGLPVVATDVGGASEVVVHGGNGILIEPGSTGSITREVLGLFDQADRRKQIAVAGQRSVRENFNAERMVNAQFNLYKHWLGQ
jgi:glycosyltransferase involved in cell wall biosynthesis